MSVVAVKKTDKKIKIAADSIVVCGWTRVEKTTKMAKLFEVNGMIIGSVGYASEGLLLENFASTRQPYAATEREVLNFFVDFNKYLVNDLGMGKYSNSFILCFKGKVFLIDSELFITEVDKYAAIGAGQDYSLAALHLGHSAKEAVEVACDLCAMVARPIIEYEMKIENEEETV